MPILLGIFLFAADQSDELIARAPPDEDGEHGVTHEHSHKDRIRRHERVHQRQSSHARISYPGKRAHAHFVGDDAGRQVEDERGDAVNGHERAELLVGAAERLHQRVVQHHLQVNRTYPTDDPMLTRISRSHRRAFDRSVYFFSPAAIGFVMEIPFPLKHASSRILPELPASSRMRNMHSSWEPFIANASSNLH